jgi:hypothetical protein
MNAGGAFAASQISTSRLHLIVPVSPCNFGSGSRPPEAKSLSGVAYGDPSLTP